jgi:hypothetical protein
MARRVNIGYSTSDENLKLAKHHQTYHIFALDWSGEINSDFPGSSAEMAGLRHPYALSLSHMLSYVNQHQYQQPPGPA